MATAKVCKFQKERKEISNDCGEIWTPTQETRKIEGKEPFERHSVDCGFGGVVKRTVISGTVCNGYDKFEAVYDEATYDNGLTWNIVESSKRLGNLLERFSSDCCELRTVSGTICTNTFEKAYADIEEASLDGEIWIQTGRYTVTSVIEGTRFECMNENGVKFLGVPYSGSTNTVKRYNSWAGTYSSYGSIPIGCEADETYSDGYVVIGCDDAYVWADTNASIEEIYISSCAYNPISLAKYHPNLKKIHFDSGVTGDIGEIATNEGRNFGGTMLEELDGFENSHIFRIGLYCFAKTKLKTVHIPQSCFYIDGHAFSGCTDLTNVIIDSRFVDVYTNSTYNWSYGQFENCTSLSSVTFTNLIGGIQNRFFAGCTSLTDVSLNNPSSIGNYAFMGCISLSSIDLGNNIESIGNYAFGSCSALTDVYIGQKKNILANVISTSFPSGVTIHVVCEAYPYWHQAYEVDHPNLGVKIEMNGSSGCVETRWVESGWTCVGVDKYTQEMKQISYDGSTWYNTDEFRSGSTLIESDSVDCGYIPQDYYIKAEWADGTSRAKTCKTSGDGGVTRNDVNFSGSTDYIKCWIQECSGTVPVTYLNTQLFKNNRTLQEVYLPSSITNITYQCFYGCTALEYVTLGHITTIEGNSFEGCYGLRDLVIPSGVTNIGEYAFYYCKRLTSITVNATTPATLGNRAFDNTNNCPIYVPCQSVPVYKTASGWSNYASRIQGIPPCTPPSFSGKIRLIYSNGESYSASCDGNTSLTSGNTRPDGYEFSGITSAEVGDCVTSIDYKAFSGATSISSITIADTVITIGNSAFTNCYSLSSITIQDSIVNIGADAFENCSGLKDVTIGSGTSGIGDYAFANCNGLNSITINRTNPPVLGKSPFWNTNDCPIYVPAEAINNYKSYTTWRDYYSRLQPIT